MDILDPFPIDLGQLKFMFVVVYYFIKWVKVDALVNITAANILNLKETSCQGTQSVNLL